ncbi:GNAT family N-acetyltransferase [Flavihumibacter petaseus]|uniref:Putative acetyltransferase n=1 Tax=Flavihumibacter petaseus NBRC 106054 TaxID=1220578 RepID=A0A0E9MZD2_9BACT|nr:GNAT family N-acetyltransferase [Flavihumibacter petaseus]GAO42974.1 putative acetyltransferase [Flavihumibacter petaseus NBRC 106054]
MHPTIPAEQILIEQLPEEAALPMDLLELAEPDVNAIAEYINYCIVLVAKKGEQVVGVLALSPETKERTEIRNIAVLPAFRKKGIARQLLQEACSRASRLGYQVLQVCTSNAGIRQLKVYQQFGFELTDVRWNYYVEHFPEPILEDGILRRHQMVLSRLL